MTPQEHEHKFKAGAARDAIGLALLDRRPLG